jgi:hypothetical protein
MKRALVLSLAAFLGLGFAALAQGELSGEWSTKFTINPAAGTIADYLDFETKLTTVYSIDGWSFGSYVGVDDGGLKGPWILDATGSFGALNISSSMGLLVAGLFQYWEADASFLFGSVDIGIGFDLYGQNVGLTLSGSASTGLLDIGIAILFGDLSWDPLANGGLGDWVDGDDVCDLDWNRTDITVGVPFNCADITATLGVTCSESETFCLSVAGIDIPNLPWVDLSALLCFELQSKTLVLTPAFDFGVDVCFDLYICQYKDGGSGPVSVLVLGDIYVAGIGLDVEFGGVSLTGISFWGTDCASLKPDALGDYWEMYKIATTEEACCGPYDFSIAAFFDIDSAYLFDIAAFEADFSYELDENFVFSMGLDYTAASGLTKWTVGLDITW